MRKYYQDLDNDEKQQVADCFNKMYGEHLGKATRVICKAENRCREYGGSVLWADIRLTASKHLEYVIPFEDYVGIYKRVLRHRREVMRAMARDPKCGEDMIVRCAQSPTDSVTINDDDYGRLAYSGVSLFNLRKEATKKK